MYGRAGAAAIKKKRQKKLPPRKGSGIHVAYPEFIASPFRPAESFDISSPPHSHDDEKLKGILKKPKKKHRRKKNKLTAVWTAFILIAMGCLIFLAGYGDSGIFSPGYKTKVIRYLGPFLSFCGLFTLIYKILMCKYSEYRKRLKKTGFADKDKTTLIENGIFNGQDHLIPTIRRNSQLVPITNVSHLFQVASKKKKRFSIKRSSSSSSSNVSTDSSSDSGNTSKSNKSTRSNSTSTYKSTSNEKLNESSQVQVRSHHQNMPNYWHIQNEIKQNYARELYRKQQRERERRKVKAKPVHVDVDTTNTNTNNSSRNSDININDKEIIKQTTFQKGKESINNSSLSNSSINDNIILTGESFIQSTRIGETSDGEDKISVEVIHYESSVYKATSTTNKSNYNTSSDSKLEKN